MVEYRKLVAKTDKDGRFDGFVTAKLATPKNVVKTADFERLFSTALEVHIAADCKRKLDAAKDTNGELTVDELATLGALDIYVKDISDEKTAELETLSDSDKRFINALVYTVLGCGYRRRWCESNAVADIVREPLKAFLSNSKYDLKALKTAFETIANNRLKTDNESGLFKSFKCRFTDEMVIHILATSEKTYKWSKNGITKATLDKAAPAIVREIMITALKKTFDFDVKVTPSKAAWGNV